MIKVVIVSLTLVLLAVMGALLVRLVGLHPAEAGPGGLTFNRFSPPAAGGRLSLNVH